MLTDETFEEISKIDIKIQKLTSEIKGLTGMGYQLQEKREFLRSEIFELQKQREVVLMLM
jgi:hypothetical protein